MTYDKRAAAPRSIRLFSAEALCKILLAYLA
jgi:hypothetical protein